MTSSISPTRIVPSDVALSDAAASVARTVSACELCQAAGGQVIVRTSRWRLVRPEDAMYPATYRLVWGAHVREFSDLQPAQRHECMDAVALVESLMREHLRPHKINLASLGNWVAHLHWHLIARDPRDAHFPQTVWAGAQRAADASLIDGWQQALPGLDLALRQAFAAEALSP